MSDFPLSPDLLLARRAAHGRQEAWAELVELFGRRVFNLAFQFTGSIEDAEDLTQEIFLRLYQSLRSYRGEAPLVAWALRLSRNHCIDHYRRARRQGRHEVISEAVLEQLPAEENPLAEAQRRQRVRLVYASLQEIAEELAEVVLLHDLQGWSFAETSAYLEVPVGTVKSRLHRARQELGRRVLARIGDSALPGSESSSLGVGRC